MNYGLYLAASGTLTNLHRQEVLTNNLANANT
ncbi:MAG: flagellar basal body protein, partial [Planctomycetota bacterium]